MMPSSISIPRMEIRKPRWLFWQWGPLLLTVVRVEHRFPTMRFPYCNWRPLGYLYAAGVGAWLWQRSNLGRIVRGADSEAAKDGQGGDTV